MGESQKSAHSRLDEVERRLANLERQKRDEKERQDVADYAACVDELDGRLGEMRADARPRDTGEQDLSTMDGIKIAALDARLDELSERVSMLCEAHQVNAKTTAERLDHLTKLTMPLRAQPVTEFKVGGERVGSISTKGQSERVCPECGCNRQEIAEKDLLFTRPGVSVTCEGISIICKGCGFEVSAASRRRALDAWDDICQVRAGR